jgi:ubiquinone/menaquinone biosynthesis C-methylase UbiE
MASQKKADMDSLVATADRDAYNKYAREHTGIRNNDEIEKAYKCFVESDIPILLKKKLVGARRTLEIGAGRAFPSISLRTQAEIAIILDHNQDPVCGLKAACALARAVGETVIPVLGSYEDAPLRDGFFDAVIAQSCLHHALRPEMVIGETYRLLQSGGRLVLIEPCKGRMISEHYAYRHYWKMSGMDQTHMNERVYNVSTWIRWLKNAGFREIRVETTYFAWASSFLKRKKWVGAAKMLKIVSSIVNTPFIAVASLFGHPPLLPHQFTRKVLGGEYFEVLMTARKP